MIAALTTLLAVVLLAVGVLAGFVWGVSYAVSREKKRIQAAEDQKASYFDTVGRRKYGPPRDPLA